MPQPVPPDILAHRRLRRTARFLTAVVCAPIGYLALAMVVHQVRGRADLALIAWVVFWWLVVLGAPVLWWAWRRAVRARPVTLAVDAGWGEQRGVPELDAPSGEHRGLHGVDPPPPRW